MNNKIKNSIEHGLCAKWMFNSSLNENKIFLKNYHIALRIVSDEFLC